MAGTITALVIQKKNKERVNVFIDNSFALAVSLNTALGLKKGRFLSDEDIHTLKQNDLVDKAYQQTLHYLSFRARTQQEIETYLGKKNTPNDIIAQVIQKLLRHKYLDDAAFGQQWVAGRNRLNPKGKQALRYELRQKGLSEQHIEQALVDVDETTLAMQAAQKKVALWRVLDKATFKKKITGYLARRGFSYETIQTVLANLRQQDD